MRNLLSFLLLIGLLLSLVASFLSSLYSFPFFYHFNLVLEVLFDNFDNDFCFQNNCSDCYDDFYCDRYKCAVCVDSLVIFVFLGLFFISLVIFA